jgi:hypothetical protein
MFAASTPEGTDDHFIVVEGVVQVAAQLLQVQAS